MSFDYDPRSGWYSQTAIHAEDWASCLCPRCDAQYEYEYTDRRAPCPDCGALLHAWIVGMYLYTVDLVLAPSAVRKLVYIDKLDSEAAAYSFIEYLRRNNLIDHLLSADDGCGFVM